jgi:hypothetical protein
METEIVAAIVAAVAVFISAVISFVTAILVTFLGYIFTQIKTKEEQRLALERLKNEQSLMFERFKDEQVEKFRMGYYQKQLVAYEKFWSMLGIASYYSTTKDTIIIKREDGVYLNCNLVQSFFTDFRDFFYSEFGLYISKDLRESVFKVRDFIQELINNSKSSADDAIKISNTKAKKVTNGFDWIRGRARADIGLYDIHSPMEKLDLSSD